MIPSPYTARKFASLRRVVALVAMALLALGGVEQLVPDVHDGDAPTIALATPGADAAPAATVATSSARAPDHGATPGAQHEHQAPTDGSPHSLHLDHCGHSHAAAPPSVVACASAPARIVARTFVRPETPPSIALAPRLRPPIA